MTRTRRRTVAVLAAATAMLASAPAIAGATTPPSPSPSSGAAADLFVLTANQTLLRLDAAGWRPESAVRVSGLNGDRLVAIDVRPATGGLYALGRSGQLYTLDATTGAATAVGEPLDLSGRAVGFDFNPTVDRIRLVTSAGENLRLVPTDGSIAAVDGTLSYAAGDDAEGRTPKVSAAAYTDSVPGATTTALFGLDQRRNTLVQQGSAPGEAPVVSPNSGTLTTVGELGIDVKRANGFDISGGRSDLHRYDPADYTAVAAVPGTWWGTTLVSIDLTDGSTAAVGILPTKVVGISFAVD